MDESDCSHSFCRYFISGDPKDPITHKKHWNPFVQLGDLDSWFVGWECRICGSPGYASKTSFDVATEDEPESTSAIRLGAAADDSLEPAF